MLYRYTTEHAVEYVIVALFCWGLVDVLLKVAAFPKESLALRHEWLPQRHGREPAANAQALLTEFARSRSGCKNRRSANV